MESNYNSLTLGLGIFIFLIGFLLTIKRISLVRKHKIIFGEIYDWRSGNKDGSFPVIKYDNGKETKEYQSSYNSIFLKLGKKMRLVFNEEKGIVISTFSELFFMPITVSIVGIFIITIMILYINEV